MPGAAELLGHRDRVDRLAAGVQRERRVVHDTVRGLVEVARLDVRLDRGGDRLAAEHHRPEEGLLGFEVVRRDPSATTVAAHRTRGSAAAIRARWAPPRIIERLNQSVSRSSRNASSIRSLGRPAAVSLAPTRCGT